MNEYRSFDGEIKLLSTKNPLVFDVELWLLNNKVNRNGWRYERLAEHMPKFAGTPLLTAYVGGQVGDGHNFRVVPDEKSGELVPTFMDSTSERIVGAISENADEIRTEERDGNTWIVGTGKLWRWYARELVNKIEDDAKQGRTMSVSIETLVTESHMEGDVEVETSYEILGTTILGDHVQPAVADARIKALQALKKPFEELKIRAASMMKEQPIKPKNNEKGVKRNVKTLNKNQIKACEAKVKGYTVLSGIQNEEDNSVALVLASKSGELCVCSMASLDAEIKPEMLESVRVSASLENGNELDVNGAMERMLSEVGAENKVLSEQVEKLNADLAAEKAKNAAMVESENKRRVQAAKAAAKAQLNEINSYRGDSEQISEDCINEVLEACDAGDYTDCCDPKTSEWCGEAKAQSAVRDICMKKQMELDKARKNSAQKKVYAFEQGQQANNQTNDSLDRMYASITAGVND